MTLFNLTAVDPSGKLLLSYYFGAATVAEQDAWESRLAAETVAYFEAAYKQDVPCVVADKFVLLRGVGEMIFILSGVEEHDELALVDVMTAAVAVVHATCDKRLTCAQVIAFHGKICVCLNEMFFGGHQVYSDVDTVLRNAKLKPPKL